MTRSIFSNWLGLVVSALVGAALTPMMIHHLGLTYYGLWILVASLLDYSGVVDSGIRAAMFRFVARWHGAGNREELNRTLTCCVAVSLSCALAVLVLLPFLLRFLPHFFALPPAQARLLRWTLGLVGASFALAFPARALGSFMSGVGRFDLYNVGAVSVIILRGAGIALVLERGLGLIAVATVTFFATLFLLAANSVLLRFADPRARVAWSMWSWGGTKELLDYGVYVFVYNCGDQLRSYTDSLVIGRVLLVGLIPFFSIATRLVEYSKQLFSAAASPVLGRLSELDGRGDARGGGEYFLMVTRYFWMAGLFVAMMFYLDGKAVIVAWVGSQFIRSYKLLLILVAGWTVEYGLAPGQLVLLAKARHRFLAYLVIGEGCSNLILSIVWARHYGLVGVAAGTAVPMLVTKVLIQPWYVLHVEDISPWRYLREGLARPTLATAAWAGLCLLPVMPGSQGGIFHLLLAVGVQTALFVPIAVLVGMSVGDRRGLRARAASLLHLAPAAAAQASQ